MTVSYNRLFSSSRLWSGVPPPFATVDNTRHLLAKRAMESRKRIARSCSQLQDMYVYAETSSSVRCSSTTSFDQPRHFRALTKNCASRYLGTKAALPHIARTILLHGHGELSHQLLRVHICLAYAMHPEDGTFTCNDSFRRRATQQSSMELMEARHLLLTTCRLMVR